MEKGGYIYILTNKSNTVLYTGVTNILYNRIYEHKHKLSKSFTSRYNIDKLVHFETFPSIEEAIQREKQIKAGSRKNKIELIERENKAWRDLYSEIVDFT